MTEDKIETEHDAIAFADELHDEALDRDDAAACGGCYTGFRRPAQ